MKWFLPRTASCMANLLIFFNFFGVLTYFFSSVLSCRLSRYQQFKNFEKRILVGTDLFGRGMDIERVNIVFNYDMPDDSDSYLHRVCLVYILAYLMTSLCPFWFVWFVL